MNIFLFPHHIFIFLLIFKTCLSDILIIRIGNNKTTEVIGDLPALFGPSLPLGGLRGFVLYTNPPDACVVPDKPPNIDYREPFIALVRRYNCSFVDKVLNAQKAGYHAVIVRNVGSNDVEVMSGDHDTNLVRIPSVFIGEEDGLAIQDNFQYDKGYVAILTDELPFNIQNYLLPFAITIGICFILMLTLMFLKCVRDYRRSRRHRLSSRALKKLPIHKFKKGDPYECCAVCLEDYVDNDKLRVLPCSHAYHSKCIDPWLTKNRRVCPVCKRKVITGDERPSDLESDSEDETAPLINSEGGTQGGTFSQQRENPFQEAERRAELRRQDEFSRTSGNSTYSILDESDSESEDETHTQKSGMGPRLNENIPTEVADLSDASDSSSTSDRFQDTRETSTAIYIVPTTTLTTIGSDLAGPEDVDVRPEQKQSPPHNDCVV